MDLFVMVLVLGMKICLFYKCSVSVFFSGIYYRLVVYWIYGKLKIVYKFYIVLNFEYFIEYWIVICVRLYLVLKRMLLIFNIV